MATNEWMQARCAHATLEAFREIGVEPSEHTALFLAIAQLLHIAATGASADMDRPCAVAIAAEPETNPPLHTRVAASRKAWRSRKMMAMARTVSVKQ